MDFIGKFISNHWLMDDALIVQGTSKDSTKCGDFAGTLPVTLHLKLAG